MSSAPFGQQPAAGRGWVHGSRVLGIVVASAALVAGIAVVLMLGLVGVSATVTAGAQSTVCGNTVGVSASDQYVQLLGVSDRSLAPGDRVRAGALCVIEVVNIDNPGSDADQDGATADIHLR